MSSFCIHWKIQFQLEHLKLMLLAIPRRGNVTLDMYMKAKPVIVMIIGMEEQALSAKTKEKV